MKAISPRHIILVSLLIVPWWALSFMWLNESTVTAKDWQILYLQDKSIDAAIKGTDWEPLNVPSTFRMPGEEECGEGPYCYAWMRGVLDVPYRPECYYGISMGRIYHADQVYINGHFIDSQDPMVHGYMHSPRNYVIPPKIIVRGKNRIYIRIGILKDEYGGLLNSVYLLPKKAFLDTQLYYNLFFNKIPFGILLAYASSLVLLFLAFLTYRREKIFHYSSLLIIISMIDIAALFTHLSPIRIDQAILFHWIAYPLYIILFLRLVQAFYRISLPYRNSITVALLATIALIVVLNRVTGFSFYTGPALAAISVIISLVSYILIARELYRIRPNKTHLIFIVCVFTFMQGVSYLDIALYLGGSRYSFIIIAYNTVIASMIFTVHGIRELFSAILGKDNLYDGLKSQIRRKPPSITDETRIKLQQIVDFIHENYTSSLSREGLAAAVDMNADYVSKLFIQYTGVKINDYINILRIREAALLLLEDDKRIIDIAFAIGFENIVSFNRTFKGIIGMTPSEFRKKGSEKDIPDPIKP